MKINGERLKALIDVFEEAVELHSNWEAAGWNVQDGRRLKQARDETKRALIDYIIPPSNPETL